MADLERQLVTALRHAWHELNAIRAQDGVAYGLHTRMPYCTEAWWNELTEKCGKAIEAATGEPPKPWPFRWELNEADSKAFVEALLDPPEPNEALKTAAARYRARKPPDA